MKDSTNPMPRQISDDIRRRYPSLVEDASSIVMGDKRLSQRVFELRDILAELENLRQQVAEADAIILSLSQDLRDAEALYDKLLEGGFDDE